LRAKIAAIEYFLPQAVLSNTELALEFPDWSVEKIESKTGITERHIAAEGECSSDLAFEAARKLFASGVCSPSQIDYILLCTQSPDYWLPTTACLLQHRLNVPQSAGALDFNLGCSGYIYGLGIAQGLIETAQANNVLLITAETYSKFLHRRDKSVSTLFGDAAAATLITGIENAGAFIGPHVLGTDGSGAGNLIVQTGGMRNPRTPESGRLQEDDSGNIRCADNLYMNGAEIFNFALRVVPKTVHTLLERAGKKLDDIDLFVFHQANQFMLDHLRKRLKIPQERFSVAMRHCGNTVSSSIPIALKDSVEKGILHPGNVVMLVGFGVGYSWGATLIRWDPSNRGDAKATDCEIAALKMG